MLKIGKILIDYDSIATIVQDFNKNEQGVEVIQIVYKNGVVKNFRSNEIGMNYEMFIKTLEDIKQKEEDKHLLKLSVLFNQNK